jgi:hypothetical protein
MAKCKQSSRKFSNDAQNKNLPKKNLGLDKENYRKLQNLRDHANNTIPNWYVKPKNRNRKKRSCDSASTQDYGAMHFTFSYCTATFGSLHAC